MTHVNVDVYVIEFTVYVFFKVSVLQCYPQPYQQIGLNACAEERAFLFYCVLQALMNAFSQGGQNSQARASRQ